MANRMANQMVSRRCTHRSYVIAVFRLVVRFIMKFSRLVIIRDVLSTQESHDSTSSSLQLESFELTAS